MLPGEPVEAGQVIGQVGMVLNDRAIRADAPLYIQKLKEAGLGSMLHLEVYRVMPQTPARTTWAAISSVPQGPLSWLIPPNT